MSAELSPGLQKPDSQKQALPGASIIKGGSVIDQADSFGLIRGGHVDATVLGTLQVDQEGNIANWIVPGRMVICCLSRVITP